ncbi:MAG TPA: DUF3016 domain-containing protein [Chthoniobacterales bacterium]|jgi:hypothetical protein
MRIFLRSLLASIVGLGLSTANAADPGNVRVDFVHPERFTDFRIQGRDENASVPIFRDEVSRYLSPLVDKRFPGEMLTLRFTDIDLAGRLSDRPRLNNVRINREWAQPIRLSFDYTVTDSKGTVVTGGSKALLGQDYLYNYDTYAPSLKRSPVFYEQAALAKWVRGLEPSHARLARD